MGSRGPKAAPRVSAAANIIIVAESLGRKISAKEAMVQSRQYDDDEVEKESLQRAVRKQAKAIRDRQRQDELDDEADLRSRAAGRRAAGATGGRRSSSSAGTVAASSKPNAKAAATTASAKRPRVEGEPIRNRQPAPVPYRRSSSQLVQQQAADNRQQARYDEAMMEATKLYAEQRKKPVDERLSSNKVAATMKEKHNVSIPASSIRDRVAKGRVGEPNDRRGPLGLIQPDHFKLLCELVATDIMLTQSSSKPDLDAPTIKKKLERFLRGTGTAAENMDVDALYIRIRSKISEFVTASLTNNVELRRQLWLSDTNFNVWFDSWKDVLVNLGFAKDEPMMDDEGNVISEVTLLPGQDRRVINFDESRICMDGTSDSPGGRPPHTLVFKTLPSTGTAVNKSSKGGTIICGSSAAYEPLPPHIQIQTDARPENMRLPTALVNGMPVVTARFGNDAPQEFPTTFGMNESGGMNAEELLKYLKVNFIPLYPDIADVPGKRVLGKIDGGPGRLDLFLLIELRLLGFYLYPSVPNGTSVGQETDRNYGPLKNRFRRNLAVVAAEQFANPDTPNTLGYEFWAACINGREATAEKPALPSAFLEAFSYEAIKSAWVSVGALPLTRACAKDPLVRREYNDTEHNFTEEEFEISILTVDPGRWDALLTEERNHRAVSKLTAAGYKADVFENEAPRRPTIMPGSTTLPGTNARVRLIANAGKSHGKLFTATGGNMLNGDDALRAQELLNRQASKKIARSDKESRQKAWAVQEEADRVKALNKADNKLSGAELNALIKHKKPKGHTAITGLKVAERRQKYIDEIKGLPTPDRVAEPSDDEYGSCSDDHDDGDDEDDVPTIAETALAREMQIKQQQTLSSIQQDDIPVSPTMLLQLKSLRATPPRAATRPIAKPTAAADF